MVRTCYDCKYHATLYRRSSARYLVVCDDIMCDCFHCIKPFTYANQCYRYKEGENDEGQLP